MKKSFFVFIIFLTVTNFSVAQNRSSELPLIGTWTCQNGNTWLFSSSGRLGKTENQGEWYGEWARYSVHDTKLAVSTWNGNLIVYNMVLSSGGRTLLLDLTPGGDSDYFYDNNFLLTLQSRTMPTTPFTGIWADEEGPAIEVVGNFWFILRERNLLSATYNGNTATMNFGRSVFTGTVQGNTLTLSGKVYTRE